jgi:hypothetical protein
MILRQESCALIFNLKLMPAHRVVEPRLAQQLEIDLAPDHGHPPNNLVGLLSIRADGHVISQLGNALFRKKPRQQYVGVRKVKLAHPPVLELRLNLKPAASFVIEQSGKYSGRIEIRVAEKIDGSVHTHKGDRAHVANHPIVFNWLEAHA